jgi:hypothetical protein
MPFGELYKSHDKPERTDPGDPSLAVIDRVHAAVVLPVGGRAHLSVGGRPDVSVASAG